MLYPVTHFVCEMLPEQMRESTRTELFFDDLEKLPSMEVSRICEWLTEKVDGFSSKTRAEPKEAEEEVARLLLLDMQPCCGLSCTTDVACIDPPFCACEAEVSSQQWLHTSHIVASSCFMSCSCRLPVLCVLACFASLCLAGKRCVPAADTFDYKYVHKSIIILRLGIDSQ